ncbi:branched-chain amino acid ABC transporter permease [Roseospirillum parvum]|uniref:Branched-chain amino acid transport system permease protein n=1 Tax=Roseospirillum parvum TaxID=83401 RepID=A0A1G8E452_9PROT|nr:branched-chain amino acid ABC transporter permease [Roseospirillum parvum]SDH64664.1 branched-chain amino acid transport system permease protein [Roseospirillum parvum]
MLKVLASPRGGGLLVLIVLIALLPLGFQNNFHYDVAIRVGFNAIVVVGLNLLIGYAGQISLGHAGFLALGAYASAILTGSHDWPPVLAMLTGAVGVGLLAFVVARPVLRLKGHYLAMATLGMGMIIAIVLNTESQLTGGPDGMSVWVSFGVAGLEANTPRQWYWLVGALLVVWVWLALNLIDSPFGRALKAVHGSEVAAEVVGVDTTSVKVTVFVVSAVVASLVGSLSAHYISFISPQEASFFHSIELVIMAVLGGMASIYGSLVGAAILTVLPQVLTAFEDFEHLVFGLVMMAVMIFMPKGIVPSLGLWLAGRARRPGGEAAP